MYTEDDLLPSKNSLVLYSARKPKLFWGIIGLLCFSFSAWFSVLLAFDKSWLLVFFVPLSVYFGYIALGMLIAFFRPNRSCLLINSKGILLITPFSKQFYLWEEMDNITHSIKTFSDTGLSEYRGANLQDTQTLFDNPI
jgi:hypothetical protein